MSLHTNHACITRKCVSIGIHCWQAVLKTLAGICDCDIVAIEVLRITSYEMQVRDCQFQMRMVWSSDALITHGYSYICTTVKIKTRK